MRWTPIRTLDLAVGKLALLHIEVGERVVQSRSGSALPPVWIAAVFIISLY
jgi:hypothetical protein